MSPTGTRRAPRITRATNAGNRGRTTRALTGPAAVRAQHANWLSLLDTDGPFLTVPVLAENLHAGLEPTNSTQRTRVREEQQTWNARATASTSDQAEAAARWVRFVVEDLLDWAEDCNFDGPFDQWQHTEHEHGVTITPAFACSDTAAPTDPPLLLGYTLPTGTTLTSRVAGDTWAANHIDRVAAALRSANVEFGLLTDGRWWGLVWAPRGRATAYAIWDSVLWSEDKVTLAAFTTLLSRRRFLGVAPDATLRGMLYASLDKQAEITDQLGAQVRSAAEYLVEAFGRASTFENQNRLDDVAHDDLYNGAITVLMRLVFMLCAEERGLLPSEQEIYLRSYSLATLTDDLAEQAAYNEGALESSTAAWHRILAAFRIVYAGADHHDFSVPGYGGSVFDPTTYPWLEGEDTRGPIPLDDRTVHYVLQALTRLTFRERGGVTESRKITYRTLDVEQIGYVYEGLLDHTATTSTDTTLGFGGKNEPELALTDLETEAAKGQSALLTYLVKQTGATKSVIARGLAGPTDATERSDLNRLVFAACENDQDLTDRVTPYAALLRIDPRGLPIVYLPNRPFVTSSSTRGDTGTHYTPRTLAEEVVATTLDALVYSPGPLDTEDRDTWRPKPAADILALTVADIAMGSGAFLVAACRYLADRLLEAVLHEDDIDALPEELAHLWVLASDRVATIAGADVEADIDEAVLYARRLVAERCLYGNDLNPMAVEMAKLSLWLIAASRDKPFGFLDHHLTAGDTLLGLTDVRQLESLHIDPTAGLRVHGDSLLGETAYIRAALDRAADLRRRIAATPAVDLRGIDAKRALLADANQALTALTLIADALSGAAIASASATADGLLDRLTEQAATHVPAVLSDEDPKSQATAVAALTSQARSWLDTDKPEGAFERHPTQWVTAFPEVFLDSEGGGFDAIIGNPPFLGGQKITGALGVAYRNYLVKRTAEGRTGSADLVTYMLLTAADLSKPRNGHIGVIATNTLAQGDTREVGLDHLIDGTWYLREAIRSRKWPGGAALEFAAVYLQQQPLSQDVRPILDGERVARITPSLTIGGRITGNPHQLVANSDQSFQGAIVLGLGFTLSEAEATTMIEADPRNDQVLQPYLNGKDLNSRPDHSASRWVINFRDWNEGRASTYRLPWQQIQDKVRPERQRVKKDGSYVVAEPGPTLYWQYLRPRPALYQAIADLDHVVVFARVSSVCQPVRVPTGQVISDQCVVFASDSVARLALLSSGFHFWWAVRYGSTLETRIRYTPSDVYETLAQPVDLGTLEPLGLELEDARRAVARQFGVGLTDMYNRVHDRSLTDCGLTDTLRDVHRRIDEAVAAAYGWNDLDLGYGHHDTTQGMKWSMSSVAQAEVLDRLLELNHARHAEDVAAGLVAAPSGGKRVTKRAAAPRAKAQAADDEDTLFG